jgi:uncharacterized protein YcaQ
LRRYPDVGAALEAWGFVQYDPIRRPARAQDLILFQRVTGYQVGDLDRAYSAGGLDEDHFYAYGVLTPELMGLVYPRSYQPDDLAAGVLDLVRAEGPLAPNDVSAVFGKAKAANDWGGLSSATTRALEALHYHGCLRVARRDNGVKVYAARVGEPPGCGQSPEERLRRLTLAIVRILSPISVTGLRRTIGLLLARTEGLGDGRRTVVGDLLASGEVVPHDIDRERYLLLADDDLATSPARDGEVSFLAPFDPVVWDRRRFEHLWGWRYRFEAYTPARQRRYGYYALPFLWGDQPIGWVNLELTASGRLDVDRGFPWPHGHGTTFEQAFADEVDRFESMVTGRTEDGEGVAWTTAAADGCS